MRIFLLSMLLLTSIGCVTVSKSLEKYRACKDDPECYTMMLSAKEASYTVTEAAVSSSIPSGAQSIALVVSNIVAFAVGVWKGKKKEV